MKSTLDANGIKVIWLLAWDGGTEPTPSMAQTYYTGHGANFGWFTDDHDNSVEPYQFHNNPMASGVPWIGVIDADTMTVAYSNPADLGSVISALAD